MCEATTQSKKDDLKYTVKIVFEFECRDCSEKWVVNESDGSDVLEACEKSISDHNEICTGDKSHGR